MDRTDFPLCSPLFNFIYFSWAPLHKNHQTKHPLRFPQLCFVFSTLTKTPWNPPNSWPFINFIFIHIFVCVRLNYFDYKICGIKMRWLWPRPIKVMIMIDNFAKYFLKIPSILSIFASNIKLMFVVLQSTLFYLTYFLNQIKFVFKDGRCCWMLSTLLFRFWV